MADIDPRLQQVIDSIDKGDRVQARTLLTDLIREDKFNPDYWLWMSAVVRTRKERSYCLNEVLKLDANNKSARYGLQMLGELPKDPSIVIPIENQKRDWQKKFEPPPPPKKPKKKISGRIVGFILILAALAAGGFGIVRLIPQLFRPEPTLSSLFGATATASLTPSHGPDTPSPTPSGPEPLWMKLEATYTPTPLYVKNEHPLLEAYSSGVHAYERSDWQNVVNFMQQVVHSQPDAWDAYYLIGDAYFQMRDFQKAFDDFNALIDKNTDYAPAYLGRARARLEISPDQWKQARIDLEKALQLDPNLGEAYLQLGAILAQHGEPDTAIDMLDTANQLLHESPLAYFYESIAYLALNDPANAVAAAQKSNELDITFLLSYLQLGIAFQANDKMEDSILPLDTYVTYEKKNPQAYVLLGKAYAVIGDAENSLAAFHSALALDPKRLDTYLQRGNVYLDLNDGEKALLDFQTARKLNSKSFDASLGIGKAQVMLTQYGNAYMTLLNLEPQAKTDVQKAELYYYEALSLEGIKNNNAALLAWQKLLRLPEDAVSVDWRTTAKEHIAILTQPTATRTGTATKTSLPSKTPTQAKPTVTPTVTKTLPATITPTRTVTPTVTQTAPPAAITPTK